MLRIHIISTYYSKKKIVYDKNRCLGGQNTTVYMCIYLIETVISSWLKQCLRKFTIVSCSCAWGLPRKSRGETKIRSLRRLGQRSTNKLSHKYQARCPHPDSSHIDPRPSCNWRIFPWSIPHVQFYPWTSTKEEGRDTFGCL